MIMSSQNSQFQTQTSEPSQTTNTLPSPILFLLLPQFTSIAFFSVVEALRVANRYIPQKYRWRISSLDGRPVSDCNGIFVTPDGSFSDMTEDVSTVILVGGDDPERYSTSALRSTLKWLSSRGITLGGVDTGQQVLAQSGLLDNYRATVHWENAPAFQELYPATNITLSLFEFDRGRLTCAGGTAGIDLVLHAVEVDHGHNFAVRISEHFMHERIRGGSEHQRHNVSDRWGVHHPKLVHCIELMNTNIEEPLSTNQLSESVELSPRQLSRVFKDHLKTSPQQFYLELRLDRAHQMLMHSDMNVISIAVACGFQSQSHFSRVYRAKFGHPPKKSRRPSGQRQFLVMNRNPIL